MLSAPFNAEVKNEWSNVAAVPICLHIVNKGSFTYTLIAIYVMGNL
jgi:hypothetical protein